ncbi:MAG: hypothetical protein HC799_09690 [Limnothrix sp. RL_2_0]|nr:hypothetical protein [Limnothrix sp. RL_2_0]
MKIAVAIAFNLCLVLANLYLLTQIPKWRTLLYQVRQKLILEERKIQAETENILVAMDQVPKLKDNLGDRRQELNNYISRIRFAIRLYQILPLSKFLKKE